MSSLDCPACDESNDALGHTCGAVPRQIETCRPAPDSRPLTIIVDRFVITASPGEYSSEGLRALCPKPIPDDFELWLVGLGCNDSKIEDGMMVPLRDGMKFYSAPRFINNSNDANPMLKQLRMGPYVKFSGLLQCKTCGVMFRFGQDHTCTPDAPRAGGPVGVDLDDTLTKLWKFSKIKPRKDGVETIVEVKLEQLHLLHEHIEHMTAENARLAGELEANGCARCSMIHSVLNEPVEQAKRQARVEALEWAARQAVMHDCDGTFGAVSVYTIEAEIQRLQAAPGGA